jgi:hypothetical protein
VSDHLECELALSFAFQRRQLLFSYRQHGTTSLEQPRTEPGAEIAAWSPRFSQVPLDAPSAPSLKNPHWAGGCCLEFPKNAT